MIRSIALGLAGLGTGAVASGGRVPDLPADDREGCATAMISGRVARHDRAIPVRADDLARGAGCGPTARCRSAGSMPA